MALLAAAALAPSDVAAQERCSGTFCDFYYGGPSPADTTDQAAAPKAAPTPLTVPGTGFFSRLVGGGDAPQPAPSGTAAAPAPAAPRRVVAVQGGGVLGMMRGDPAERCTGTFCDFYYGGPPPEKPDPPPTAGAADPQAAPDAAADPTPQDAADEDPAPVRHRAATQRPAPPACAAGTDPWHCYR